MKYKKNAEISGKLTIRSSDAAGDVFIPDSVDDIVMFTYNESSFEILAGGSNIIAGKIEKPLLYLGHFGGSSVTEDEDDEHVIVYLASGIRISDLLNYCINNGFSGLEFMAGIPGTIGGAVYGNASVNGRSWSESVISLLYAKKGEVYEMIPLYGYRTLINKPKDNFVILSVKARLKKSTTEAVRASVNEYLKKRIKIKWPSAGSVFKNPANDFAGRLIEAAELKGYNVNDAYIYEEHANIFVNKGEASFNDFVYLRDIAIEKVKDFSGIILEPEVRFMGKEQEVYHA